MENLNADLLLQEAKRLADAEIALLNSMLKIDGQPSEKPSNEQEAYLDREQINQYIQVLQEAKLKLDDSKMVIAVVGTMKAGKSTTINAIVGSEVLPNRNLPMTALPTAICHTPGQIDPILNFENIQPINDLIGQIRSVAANKKFETVDEDTKKLLSWIEKGNVCQKQYKGTQEIFSFLKHANDIVRLSKDLGLKFPYEKYKQINEFPCIYIEFSHLKEKDNQKGKLILLDTPGPNEYGQSEELRKMLQEQLQRANAILAVSDYTQLESNADAEVRGFLKKVSEKSDKIYAIVNKFDQKGDHSLDKEAVRDKIANELMKDIIKSKDQVFPVSSLDAFISNRARNEILRNNQLPSPEKEIWVKTFGKKAFGEALYQKSITNSDLVLEGAKIIWENSYFKEPIDEVLQKAHQQALSMLISSFTENLDKISQQSVNHSNFLLKNFSKKTTQKEQERKNLSKAVFDITEMREKLRTNAEQFELIKKKPIEDLNKYIQEIKSCISMIFLQDSAKILLNKFTSQSSITSALTTLQKKLENYLSSAQEVVSGNLTKTQEEVKKQIEEIKKIKTDLASKGVKINEFNLSADHIQISDLIIEDEISIIYQNIEKSFSTETEIIKKKKRKGFFGEIGKALNTLVDNDIGKEKVKKQVTYYCADVEEIKENTLELTNRIFYTALTKLHNQLEKLEESYLLALEDLEEKAIEKQREQEEKIAKIQSESSKTEQEKSKIDKIINGFKKIHLDLDLLSQDIKKV